MQYSPSRKILYHVYYYSKKIVQVYFVGVLLLLTRVCTAFNVAFNREMQSLNPTRKDVAIDVLKNIQSKKEILHKLDFHSEFSTAQIWCKTHESDDHYSVSFVCDNSNKNSIDYIVLYRQKQEVFWSNINQRRCCLRPMCFSC